MDYKNDNTKLTTIIVDGQYLDTNNMSTNDVQFQDCQMSEDFYHENMQIQCHVLINTLKHENNALYKLVPPLEFFLVAICKDIVQPEELFRFLVEDNNIKAVLHFKIQILPEDAVNYIMRIFLFFIQTTHFAAQPEYFQAMLLEFMDYAHMKALKQETLTLCIEYIHKTELHYIDIRVLMNKLFTLYKTIVFYEKIPFWISILSFIAKFMMENKLDWSYIQLFLTILQFLFDNRIHLDSVFQELNMILKSEYKTEFLQILYQNSDLGNYILNVIYDKSYFTNKSLKFLLLLLENDSQMDYLRIKIDMAKKDFCKIVICSENTDKQKKAFLILIRLLYQNDRVCIDFINILRNMYPFLPLASKQIIVEILADIYEDNYNCHEEIAKFFLDKTNIIDDELYIEKYIQIRIQEQQIPYENRKEFREMMRDEIYEVLYESNDLLESSLEERDENEIIEELYKCF